MRKMAAADFMTHGLSILKITPGRNPYHIKGPPQPFYLRKVCTLSMNRLTRSTSTSFSNTPFTLNVVPTTAPSAMLSSFSTVFSLTPVFANTTVSGTVFFTCSITLSETAEPAVSPDTQRASALQLNTVLFAIWVISRSARYFAASGTILNSILTSCAPISTR